MLFGWAGMSLERVTVGRYPAPVTLGSRITAWRIEDVRALINTGVK
jgi:hypothetical protein